MGETVIPVNEDKHPKASMEVASMSWQRQRRQRQRQSRVARNGSSGAQWILRWCCREAVIRQRRIGVEVSTGRVGAANKAGAGGEELELLLELPRRSRRVLRGCSRVHVELQTCPLELRSRQALRGVVQTAREAGVAERRVSES